MATAAIIAGRRTDERAVRVRLSYRRAAELFEAHATCHADGLHTLHQLRHSRLTHPATRGADQGLGRRSGQSG